MEINRHGFYNKGHNYRLKYLSHKICKVHANAPKAFFQYFLDSFKSKSAKSRLYCDTFQILKGTLTLFLLQHSTKHFQKTSLFLTQLLRQDQHSRYTVLRHNTDMCVCVRACVRACVRVSVCLSVRLSVPVCMCVCVCACVRACVRPSVCMCVYE